MAQTKRPAAKKPASTKTVGKKAPAPKGATATPKDAPTAAEHFRRSCAARQKHAGVIARMDETTFKPHVGKSFTLTDRRGGEIKATLTRITVPKETPAGAIRHPFWNTVWSVGGLFFLAWLHDHLVDYARNHPEVWK